MESVLKIPSLESGEFNDNVNIVTFDMPDNQFDLSKSYITMQADVSHTGYAGGQPNYAFFLKNKDGSESPYEVPNNVMVRHAHLECSKGVLESIRRCDILNTQLHSYTKSLEEKESERYYQIVRAKDAGNISFAPGMEVNKLGNSISKNNSVEIVIPLNSVFQSGNSTQFPADKLGGVRASLEMQFESVLGIKQLQANSADAVANVEFGNAKYREVEDVALNATTLTTKNKFFDMGDSPYYVGMKLTVSGTGGNDYTCQITSIARTSVGANTGILVLTVDTACPNALTAVSVKGVDVTGFSVLYSNAELTLYKKPSVDMGAYEFLTFENEADNGNNLQRFERQYNLPANCNSVMVCLPDPANDVLCVQDSTLAGSQFNVSNYRMRLEGHGDLTSQDVSVDTPLYFDMVAQTLGKGVKQFKDAQEKAKSTTSNKDNSLANGRDLLFIGSGANIPVSASDKNLQININTTTAGEGVQSIQLYKQVIKSYDL